MEISIFATIIYLTATVALCVGFFMLKKTDEDIYVATWLPVTAIGLMGYQTMVAAIIGLVGIPINIISIGIFNLIPAIAIWIIILKNKERQKYIIEKVDVLIWCVLVGTIVLFALIRYTPGLLPNYNSVDASVHFTMAMDVVNNQTVNTMFFAALHNGLLIESFAPFVSATFYCKIYVLGDVLYLLMAGIMFWGLIRRFCSDNFLKLSGIFATVMYLFAYPLNSTLFGFSYMGLGVTVIAFIIAVADIYVSRKIDIKLTIMLLSFGCVSIFQAYVLFMPVVFFSLLACLLIEQSREKKLFSKQTIGKGLSIFLLPTAIGLWYTYRGFFGGGDAGTGGTSVGSAIAIEGGIYGDLFSNFVFIIPLVLFAWWMLFKDKKNNIMLYMLPMEVIFVTALFVMALSKKVSAYYFYKNYYVMWLLFVMMAFVALSYLEKQARVMVGLGAITWFIVMASGFLQFDDFVAGKNELLHDRVEAEAFGDVYMFNRSFLFMDEYSIDKIELYRYANEQLLDGGATEQVLIAASWEDQLWFDAITNQRLTKYSMNQLVDIINNKSAQYIVVLDDTLEYPEYAYCFENLERIYETPEGYVVKVY